MHIINLQAWKWDGLFIWVYDFWYFLVTVFFFFFSWQYVHFHLTICWYTESTSSNDHSIEFNKVFAHITAESKEQTCHSQVKFGETDLWSVHGCHQLEANHKYAQLVQAVTHKQLPHFRPTIYLYLESPFQAYSTMYLERGASDHVVKDLNPGEGGSHSN